MSDAIPEIEKLYSTAEVADTFGVTAETVRTWIQEKKLGAIRIGKNGPYRVRRSELMRFAQLTFPDAGASD